MAVVRQFRGLLACLALAGALGACTPFFSERADSRSGIDSRETYRARMEKEVEVAVAAPAAKVCRQLTVGIGNREWVRGIVVEVAAGSIGVRIDDPGRYLHTLNGVELQRGSVIRDAIGAWVPCL